MEPQQANDARESTGEIVLRTAPQAGQALALDPLTIRRLGYARKIREYRCGRAVRYNLTEILDWMAIQGKR